MDTLAHGLWAYLISKFTNLHSKKKLKNWLVAVFGVLPDLLSFTSLFTWLIFGFLTGSLNQFPHPSGMEPASQDSLFIFNLTHFLYNFTHSIFIFLAFFLIIWLIFRKPLFELFGWLLHILIDIPSHSYQFYPTPFLWPLSEWKFDGFSWANPWFMIINYSALVFFFFFLGYKTKKINRD